VTVPDHHIQASAEMFALLALGLHQERGLTETMEAVLEFALGTVDRWEAALFLAKVAGNLEIAAVTDSLVEQADHRQLGSCAGPAPTVLADGLDLVLVSDTTDDDRWPDWAAGVADLGLRSVLALRLQAGDTTLGVLQLFSRKPFAFEPEDVEVARIIALHASVAVSGSQQEAMLRRLADGRTLIGQAQGILMERLGANPDEAFALLRRYSQDHNVKLREVARLLTQNREFPA
jgi:GAF domain-containing protein